MKIVELEISKFQEKSLFFRINDKQDIIRLIISAVKLFMIKDNLPLARDDEISGKLILCIDKMSRLFLCQPEKVTSVCFPFQAKEIDGSLIFNHSTIGDIDNRVTSAITAILNHTSFNSPCAAQFADPIIDLETDIEGIWNLMRSLLIYEDGYLRYDYDLERANGDKHPLNHIDVFYSSNSCFKLGLNVSIGFNQLKDILDLNTNCAYLTFRNP